MPDIERARIRRGCRFPGVPFVYRAEHGDRAPLRERAIEIREASTGKERAVKPNSISGVSYLVQDLARTAEFYESIGFRRGKEEAGRATFYVNWFFVTFVEDANADSAAERGSGVFLHLKVDNLDEARTALASLGLTPEERGKNELVVRDPDGYQLVFFYKK
jgi:catechol 2,3-dioxygenase-like lactoylglutathione lyase family enzyme